MMWCLIPVGKLCSHLPNFLFLVQGQGGLNLDSTACTCCAALNNFVYLTLTKQVLAERVSSHTWFVLRNINPQSELFASSDVEAQAVVIWRGEEMYDPAESAVCTGFRRRSTALLHHHPPVNQIHPTHTHTHICKRGHVKTFSYTAFLFSTELWACQYRLIKQP